MEKTKIEIEGFHAFYPLGIQKKVFVVSEDGDDYIILKHYRVPKHTIYKDEQDFKNKNAPGKTSDTLGSSYIG